MEDGGGRALRELVVAKVSEDELAEVYDLEAKTREMELGQLYGRFARARKKDPTQALSFLLADVAWRKEVGAAALRAAPPPLGDAAPSEVAEYYERKLLGLDRQGRPVYYQNYRHLVVRRLLALVSLENLERYHVWEQERAVAIVDELCRMTRHRSKHPGTMSVVLDVGGMTLRKHVNSDFLKFLKVLATADQHHYPERMAVTFVINAPRAFGVVWSVVKPWLDPKTAEKIKIYSASEAQWRPAIDDALGPDIGRALAEERNLDPVTAADSDAPRQVARRLLREQRDLLSSEEEAAGTLDIQTIQTTTRESSESSSESESSSAESSSSSGSEVFHEALSPKPCDEDIARELWIAPISAFGGRLQLGGNVDEVADLLERCVGLQFAAALGVVVAAGVALKAESRRAPFLAILASLASVPFGLLGLVGARRRNASVLSAHVVAQAAVSAAFFGLAVAFFVVASAKSSEKSSFFDRSSSKPRNMRKHYFALGVSSCACFCCIVVECLVAAKLATRLRRALFSSFQLTTVFGTKDDERRRRRKSQSNMIPTFRHGLKSPVFRPRGENNQDFEDDGHHLGGDDDETTARDSSSRRSRRRRRGERVRRRLPWFSSLVTTLFGSSVAFFRGGGDVGDRNGRRSSSRKIARNVDVADRQLRLALASCSVVIGFVGVAGVAYGAASTSYFVRRNIGGAALAPYLLIQSSVLLLLVALLGFGIAASERDQSGPKYFGARERSDLLAKILDLDPRADRLRRLVKRDAQLLFEMRVYRILALANVGLSLVCACVALSQVVSVKHVVKRDGDRRPQVARTASLALVLVSALALLASGALCIGLRAATALVTVQKQRRRLRTRQLRAELRKRRQTRGSPPPGTTTTTPGTTTTIAPPPFRQVDFRPTDPEEHLAEDEDDPDGFRNNTTKEELPSSLTARFLSSLARRTSEATASARERIEHSLRGGPRSATTRRQHPGFDDLVRHSSSYFDYDEDDLDDDSPRPDDQVELVVDDDDDDHHLPHDDGDPATTTTTTTTAPRGKKKKKKKKTARSGSDDDADDDGFSSSSSSSSGSSALRKRSPGAAKKRVRDLEHESTAEVLGVSYTSDADPPLAAGLAHLSGFEKGLILWATLTGLARVFLDGTYAIFHVLVTKHGDDGRRRAPWFMALWQFYGRVDARYRRAENFVVSLNAVSALIAGPLCLVFAFVTYERRPSRHALAIVAAVVELATTVLYFATEARAGLRDCAGRDDVAFFWLGFVGLTVLRFLIPVPVLLGAITHVAEDAAVADRWRAVVETRNFGALHARYTRIAQVNGVAPTENDDDEQRPPRNNGKGTKKKKKRHNKQQAPRGEEEKKDAKPQRSPSEYKEGVTSAATEPTEEATTTTTHKEGINLGEATPEHKVDDDDDLVQDDDDDGRSLLPRDDPPGAAATDESDLLPMRRSFSAPSLPDRLARSLRRRRH